MKALKEGRAPEPGGFGEVSLSIKQLKSSLSRLLLPKHFLLMPHHSLPPILLALNRLLILDLRYHLLYQFIILQMLSLLIPYLKHHPYILSHQYMEIMIRVYNIEDFKAPRHILHNTPLPNKIQRDIINHHHNQSTQEVRMSPIKNHQH